MLPSPGAAFDDLERDFLTSARQRLGRRLRHAARVIVQLRCDRSGPDEVPLLERSLRDIGVRRLDRHWGRFPGYAVPQILHDIWHWLRCCDVDGQRAHLAPTLQLIAERYVPEEYRAAYRDVFRAAQPEWFVAQVEPHATTLSVEEAQDFFVAVRVAGDAEDRYLLVEEEDVPEGAVVWRYNATVAKLADTVCLSAREIAALEPGAQAHFRRYCWQDGEDRWCGCKGSDAMLDRINFLQHSCDPCLWFDSSDDNCLVARRPLKRGDVLTIEYATCDASDTIDLGCACACGAATCRQHIRRDDWKLPDVRRMYRGHMRAFLEARWTALDGRG
jgi:hypothetical protein